MATATDLAGELLEAYAEQRLVTPPSSREGGLDLATAYAAEAEIVRRRVAAGHRPVGLKVGFANKAAWRLHKLETLVWAHMYEDTVQRTVADRAELPVGRFVAPKIEPEIVLCVKGTPAEDADAAGVLEAVEWIALGFEIIDCVFIDWQFQPVDLVASRGLHAGLIVGTPLALTSANRGAIADALPTFTVSLAKNGEVVAAGSGKNALGSPALCLGELAAAIARSGLRAPLQLGELISSGTLTESQPMAANETWTATVEGLDLPRLTLRTTAD
jgi:2-oxo-3-hexenedioate decarboxylase